MTICYAPSHLDTSHVIKFTIRIMRGGWLKSCTHKWPPFIVQISSSFHILNFPYTQIQFTQWNLISHPRSEILNTFVKPSHCQHHCARNRNWNVNNRKNPNLEWTVPVSIHILWHIRMTCACWTHNILNEWMNHKHDMHKSFEKN